MIHIFMLIFFVQLDNSEGSNWGLQCFSYDLSDSGLKLSDFIQVSDAPDMCKATRTVPQQDEIQINNKATKLCEPIMPSWNNHGHSEYTQGCYKAILWKIGKLTKLF